MAAPTLATAGAALNAIGYEGGIVDLNEVEIMDFINDQATAIDFGRVVVRSAADNTCKLITAESDSLLGIAMRQPTLVPTTVGGEIKFNQYDVVPVVRKGYMYLKAYQNVTRGDRVTAVIGQAGQVSSAAAAVTDTGTSAAKSGGNTGTGALTMDATTPVLSGAVDGVYTVRCITAATDSGTFRVTAPNGTVLGDVAVGATFANQVKFAIADGGTDFIVGDGFDITVAVNPNRVELGNSTWETTTTAGELGIVRVDM